MNGPWPRYALETGNRRIVAAKLPAEHARALRTYAAANGVPLQSILKALVADWVKVNQEINRHHAGTVAATAPLVVIPTTHQSRENTGRNETVATLQKIDASRKEKRDAAKVRD